MNNPVTYSKADGACVITISCSVQGNPVCMETLDGLFTALDVAEGDRELNLAVIRSGQSGVFSKGHDIEKVSKADIAVVKQYNLMGQRLVSFIRNMKKPVLAAVDGDCFGPAFELILACDMVFATAKSRFGFNETEYGFVPGFGGTQLAARKAYETFAKYLVFTGEPVDAAELYGKGMVSKVLDGAESLEKAVTDMSVLMSKRSSFAVGLAKETINSTIDMDFAKGLLLEQNAFTFSFSTFDKTEGTSAFVEKREAKFKDRWEDYRF
ncbi:enoyl-CoA hydratase-related protein [Seleniivibrio sp.]|uniref:enoyl-CoA hydratase/isomerase family protein n=1 Tax=Seleniivibrio sp. TaxID=2898801 RepID=UPI0025D176BE|nr:enoyl-CoA hydratase-related protein [Seleniivibrio sp.]MCD8554636.1 enoyl-CoA hydratase-related protein [Seleniivibrio sp.]